MTLTIKIPPIRQPPPLQPAAPEEPMEQDDVPARSSRNRQRSKRYLEAQEDAPQEPERKIPRTARTEKFRRRSVSEPVSDADIPPPEADDPDVVMNSGNDEPEDRHSDARTQWTASSGRSQAKSGKKGKAQASSAPARKKKRHVVVSDSEDEDDYMDTTLDIVAEDEDDEDYHSPPEEKPTKSKGKGKATSTKMGTGKGGIKRKAKAEPSETGYSGPEKKYGSKTKAKPAPKTSESMIDVVGDSAPEGSVNVDHSSPATAKQDSPPPPVIAPPKKQKLPTIKKMKLTGSSGVSTPVSATPSTSKLPKELGLNNKLNHDGIRKTMINQTDIDLTDKSIYQAIFLKAGGEGGMPRRTKEEERRKELNRMRDETKAKRMEEAKHTFDLQAQYDKITRFEDKLRAERSSALWPNFLGAKWREEYEREKRRQKEQQWQETIQDNREEGEVN